MIELSIQLKIHQFIDCPMHKMKKVNISLYCLKEITKKLLKIDLLQIFKNFHFMRQ